MEMTEKKNDLKSMMVESMEKVKEMVDANNIVGEPITTPDGVTLIPISRLSYGFGCGGGDYGKNKEHSGAGCGAGVRVEPMAFLVVKVRRVGEAGAVQPQRVAPHLIDHDHQYVRSFSHQAILLRIAPRFPRKKANRRHSSALRILR